MTSLSCVPIHCDVQFNVAWEVCVSAAAERKVCLLFRLFLYFLVIYHFSNLLIGVIRLLSATVCEYMTYFSPQFMSISLLVRRVITLQMINLLSNFLPLFSRFNERSFARKEIKKKRKVVI